MVLGVGAGEFDWAPPTRGGMDPWQLPTGRRKVSECGGRAPHLYTVGEEGWGRQRQGNKVEGTDRREQGRG